MLLFDPQTGEKPPAAVGGKALSLFRLQQGHRVPEWVAVPADSFLLCLENAGLGERIAQALTGFSEDAAADTAETVRSLILAAPFPEDLHRELAEGVGAGLVNQGYVSVRSSSADEDGARCSFAGIHESFLFVKGVEAIAEHIRRVWASGYHDRALLYRHRNGLDLHPVRMGVIIQRMIDAQTAGVVFTADPNAGNPYVMVISSLYGLGEGLVGAGLAADHVVYDKRSGEFNKTVAEKESRFCLDAGKSDGVKEVPVAPELRSAMSLSDPQLRGLVRIATKIESEYRHPQDIEFCFDSDGELSILQSRDITTIEEPGPAAGNRQVWDNANIVESYSGPTSPMTFSFIRHAYTVVYHCFSEVMGIPAQAVHANRHVFENMLGLIHGQVYYNLVNWYRLIQQFPGYAMNKRFMESMMGLRERFDPEDDESVEVGFFRKWFVEFPQVLRLLLRMLYRFQRLEAMVQDFQSRFRELYERWETMEFDSCAPHELMAVYHDMEDKLLWHWQPPIVNDFYVMVFYGLLKKVCRDWCGDEQQSLQNDLICGNGDIESTEPTRLLMRLALRIRADSQLLKLFKTHDAAELAEAVPGDPACAEVAAEVERYLKEYGFRCINELKLEEPSLRETPEFLYRVLQNYLSVDAGMLDADAMQDREIQIRRGAEDKAEDALRNRSFAFLRKPIFRKVLRNARKGVRNRENMRFCRTRIYGVLRELINAMGRKLMLAGKLADPADVYFLTIDELWDFVKGTAVTTDLGALAAVRKQEFKLYKSAQCPQMDDHFETYGMVYWKNTFREPVREAAGTGDLAGTGCCPGTVTAPVRIVHSPRDNLELNGCILVAARTDPGWVPLYPAVAGILIERGSILSHSAIVAREMGIPTIVGVQGLIDVLTEGQIVTMDGHAGTVTIAERHESSGDDDRA